MLINCPECGHEISDRAHSCPHCGCPIATEELKEEPKTQKEEQQDSPKAILYYQEEGCKLASDIWEFDGISIPVKSVSSVSTEKTEFPWLGIYALSVPGLVLLLSIFAESEQFIAISIAVIVVIILYLILRHQYYLVVTNNSGSRTTALGSKNKNHIRMLYNITQDILKGEDPKTPEEYQKLSESMKRNHNSLFYWEGLDKYAELLSRTENPHKKR